MFLLFNLPYSRKYSLTIYVDSIALLLIFCIAGLLIGYTLSFLVKKLSRREKIDVSQKSEDNGLDSWIVDDQPIKCESESLFQSYPVVARRILKRILTESHEESHILPSIALIGPYGSGKTSICNLVEDIYNQEKKEPKLPEIIFCRFEAWQFLSAEAAVRNLIKIAAETIQELVDVAALWRIPEKYIEAIKGSGSKWTRLIGALLVGSHDTHEIISVIGDTLLRLDIRLVIFVDDFDRIEEDSIETQKAIAKALNQLQNLPNTQYVISVGPTKSIIDEDRIVERSWDLLKLTRFQELVPEVDPNEVVELMKQLRGRVLKDEVHYLPWSEIKENEPDLLTWHPEFSHLYSKIGFLGKLIQLINTPRILKCTFRESSQAWEGGLKGEIDWHDLVLANALKAAEPSLFEWIARDRDIFIGEPSKNTTEPEAHANKTYTKELEKQLAELIKSKEPTRYEIIKDAVCELFPAFETKLNAGEPWSSPPQQWSQKIALRPNHGVDYIERFFAGCVPENDIKDQPTLQYLRRVSNEEFNVKEFQSLYLDTQDKLTGSLNKIVQFAGLIPERLALRICEEILEWIAEPKHAECWSDPGMFMFDLLPNVFAILDKAGRRERESSLPESTVSSEREKWLTHIVQIHAQKTPILAAFMVQGAIEKGYKEAEILHRDFLNTFNGVFVIQRKQLLPSLFISPFALTWLLERISKYNGYQDIKKDFTKNIIAEADNESGTDLRERIVFSLVVTTTPLRGGNIPPEKHHFSVEKNANEQRYDMETMIEALHRWFPVRWSDEIAKKAYDRLKQEYNIC